MWLIVVVVLVSLLGILKYRAAFKGYENVDDMFPGPPTHMLIGNTLDFYGNPHFVYQLVLKFRLLYRRSIRLWVGPMLAVCLATPKEVEVLLNSTTHLKKSKIYDPVIPWVGAGLLTSHGQKWKTHRKTITPAFHFKILESYIEVFNKNSKIFSTILEEKVGSPSFEVFELVKLYTLDVICETTMGTSINAQNQPNSEYVRSVKAMVHICFLRFVRPWLQPDFIFMRTKHGRVQKKALTYLHGFTQGVIKKKIGEREMNRQKEEDKKRETEHSDIGIKKKKALLDLLLDSFDEGLLTFDEVQEEVDTFIFVGHDTMTSAISFALYSLAEHPDYQDKVYEELLDIFGGDDRDPTFDDLNRMKFMEMFIKETLRLYPSAPVFGRTLEEDLKLDEGATCPKGAQVVVFVPCIHRDPSSWQRPNEFYPDHFLPELVAKRHPYAYMPFSAGSRNCIGQKFAMMELKTTLCQIVRHLKLVPATPKVELKLGIEATLQSETGIMIAVVKRKWMDLTPEC